LERSIRYWPGVAGKQNFGDYLTELIADELFLPIAVRARGIHIIGSCLDDMFFEAPADAGDPVVDRLVFWGCGLRRPDGVSEENRKRCTILAVRGPLSRSALRLGDSVPIGDPALLLPAIYRAALAPATTGRSVCIPHVLDDRSDVELRAASGCEVVLRSAMPNSTQAVRQLIDQIASAEFVLSASLHGAIVAAAYGRPFAFWDSGRIDLPFKWADTAALLSMSNEFARDLTEARAAYAAASASLRIPSVWPLLSSAPLLLRPEAMLRVLRFEAAASGRDEAAAYLESALVTTVGAQQIVDDLSGHVAGAGDWPARAIARLSSELDRLGASDIEFHNAVAAYEEQLRDLAVRLDVAAADTAQLRGELAAQRDLAAAEGTRLREELAHSTALFDRERHRSEELEGAAAAARGRIADLELELQQAHSAAAREREIAEHERKIAAQERNALREHEAAQAARLSSWMPGAAPGETMRKLLESLPLRQEAREVAAVVRARGRRLTPKWIATSLPALPGIRWLTGRASPVNRNTRRLLARSGLFDAEFYLRENPDVMAAGTDPLDHYLDHGANERRDPSRVFSTSWYLIQNPDVAASGMNPLRHYLEHGWSEGRRPNPLFDPRWYLAQNPDVAAVGVEPMTHYLRHGAAERRKPAAGFEGGLPAFFDELKRRWRTPPSSQVAGDMVAAASPHALATAPVEPLPESVRNRCGPRVLFIDATYPSPDRDSGSVTARHLIDIFLEFGWQVSFYADADPEGASPYAQVLASAGVRCLYAREVSSIDAFLAAEGATLALCMLFRVHSGARHYETVRRTCPSAKIVFETVDLHFLREERQARVHDDRVALNVALGVRERELYVARNADLAIVVSEYERELLERETPGVRAATLPLILDCPGRKRAFGDRWGICFVGGYKHVPNLDAVDWFLEEIWPLVLKRLPTCTFSIVGSDMPERYASRTERNVVAIGYVRDLDAFLDTVRLTVAPLRYGAGVKGKIGSSLANGVPCVATPVAAEGMGLVVGSEIAVGATPAELADRIVALHEDEVEWNRMSSAGWKYVSRHYSLDAAKRRISEMLRGLSLPANVADGAASKSA
jgi:hypothetical protein